MMRITMLASALAAVSMIGWSTTAQSQQLQDDPRREEATRLVREGMNLHDHNQETEALAKYEKAYATFPSPNILLNLARQEQITGNKLKALRHFREAIRSPILPPGGITFGKKYIAELEPSFARLDLTGPTGLVVALSNEDVKLPLPEPLDIEPGTITARGVMNGQRYEGSGKAVAGKTVTVEMKVPSAPMELPKTEHESYWTGEHIAGVTTGGLAVVAAGFGVGFLAVRSTHISDTRSITSDPNVCAVSTDSSCGRLHNAQDSAKTAAIVSGVSFGFAAALGVAAGYLLWPKQKEAARTGTRVIPTTRGILVEGTF